MLIILKTAQALRLNSPIKPAPIKPAPKIVMRSVPVPEALVLQIPTLNDQQADFVTLFQLWQTVVGTDSAQVIFDFTGCRFLRQNAVAFLGGLARLLAAAGREPVFAWPTLRADIQGNLEQNGFRAAFEQESGGWRGNSIPYREDPEADMGGIWDYLDRQWLGRDWVQIEDSAKQQIISTVLEIYSNAFEHGQSSIGTFSCGQRYPSLKLLKLTTIDFGVGIPANVCEFLQQPTLRAEETLKWAFQLGTTTRPGKIPGGCGLDSLKNFVRQRQGKIEIYSHDGYALIDSEQERYESSAVFFQGTLINVTIRCDSAYYA